MRIKGGELTGGDLVSREETCSTGWCRLVEGEPLDLPVLVEAQRA